MPSATVSDRGRHDLSIADIYVSPVELDTTIAWS
jgi:hypothetical protein